MAVNLVTTNASTRSGDDAVTDENKVLDVDHIVFYFFDAEGNAFAVNGSDNFVTGSSMGSWTAGSGNTEISNTVVVLDSKSGEVPAQMVTVVNANYTVVSVKSLADLRTKVLSITDSSDGRYLVDGKNNYFVMSTSVYNDGQDNLYATPISSSNFAFTADAASSSPVNVYVERVTAKVTLTEPAANTDASSNKVVSVLDDSSTKSITVHGTTTEGDKEYALYA